MRKSLLFFCAAAALGLTVVTTSGCGGEKYQSKTGGGEELMQKVKTGQPMYVPPAGAPTGKGGPATSTMMPGGASGGMPGAKPMVPPGR